MKSEDPPTKLQYGADRGFSTSFLELLVAICASESKASYRQLFQAFWRAVHSLCQATGVKAGETCRIDAQFSLSLSLSLCLSVIIALLYAT